MPDKEKKPEFVVTDRRKFTSEGERRADEVAESQPAPPPAPEEPPRPRLVETPPPAASAPQGQKIPPPPSAAEQPAQKDAYNKSTDDIDARLRQQLGGGAPQDFQITFERFVASLYMSALMQLGLLREEGAGAAPGAGVGLGWAMPWAMSA